LLEEIKAMEGAKWHGFDELNPRKCWSIPNTGRNRFQLAYLCGENPYQWYDLPIIDFTDEGAYAHQNHQTAFELTRHQCIIAAEMGVGKTRAVIRCMEKSGKTKWLWVGPKSSLYAVQNEFKKWKAKISPTFVTYEGLEKIADYGLYDNYEGVVFDEASRLKNPTAKRSQRARKIADELRLKYGQDAYIILMSGSPAPKSPVDWWNLCEIACPGFLKEGHVEKLRKRLALIEMSESPSGGMYPKLITWRDNEMLCNICGRSKEDHSWENGAPTHVYTPMQNEVAKLYRRMKGLVLVQFKKDCLDLPELQYREILCEPTAETLRAARLLQKKVPSAIVGLTLLRELSDGFQYAEEAIETHPCPCCEGKRTQKEKFDLDNPDLSIDDNMLREGHRLEYDGMMNVVKIWDQILRIGERDVSCSRCSGTGSIVSYIRKPKMVPCPKDQAFEDLLDEHDDVGRLVVYGGFTGTIDRVIGLVQKNKWDYIRVDGRGWQSTIPGKPPELLEAFQERKDNHPRLVFVGQPGAAGMGLNLTASPSIVYYSNDFNAESRIQSEARIHRPGMDVNRGACIIDLIHLPTDRLVIENLRKKRRLQDMSMGQLGECLQ
jgi:SNF2 family DNA or RNA helicase